MSDVLTNLKHRAGNAARSVGLRKRAGTDAEILRRLPGGRALIRTGHGVEREVQYFFVAGFGKSGTNWVSSLLNLHPLVRCEGEFNLNGFDEALERFTGKDGGRLGGQEPYRSIAKDACHSLVERVLTALLDDKPNATHVGDRTPRALRPILPGAPTIWMVRDPRDVIVSYTYHYLRLKPEFNISHWSSSIREFFTPFAERYHESPPESCFATASDLLAQKRWVGFVAQQWAMRSDADHEVLERLDTQNPVLQIRYEELHADVETGRSAMYTFLGLDPTEADPVAHKSNTQAGFQCEDPGSFYRKGAVGDWKNYDTPAFREAFDEYAGEAAARAGYGNWTSAA